jgi:hypothetical protein
MNRILRLTSLALALVITIGLVATTTAPAQAQQRSTATPRAADHVHVAVATNCVDKECPADDGMAISPGPQELASSWCGNWWRGPMWCVNFNRSEQTWLSGISLTAATSAICGASLGFGCIVAASVAYAMQRYVDEHGICPSGRPILEVEYAPSPGGHVACSNG